MCLHYYCNHDIKYLRIPTVFAFLTITAELELKRNLKQTKNGLFNIRPLSFQKLFSTSFPFFVEMVSWVKLKYMLFFISNTFISNVRLKLVKNQANTKKHSEAEFLLFENYLHSSSTLASKNNRRWSKK